MRAPLIKICCIASADEAWTAITHGASALGLVSAMPSGPGPIPDARITEVARAAPPGIATFLLTSQLDADAIIDQQRRAGASTLQLVDAVPPGTHARLRAELPGVKIVQVVHVVDDASVDEAIALAPHVDALLLDSGNPKAAVKELGGTGRVHDWRLSRRIREAVDVPLYLAGGLRADNVGDAIRAVLPFGVDVCSGVRTDGALDPAKLRSFVNAVATASRAVA